MLVQLNESEFNLVLGALRLWQRTDAQSIPDSILDISEPDDGPDGLNDAQIDVLCERINTEKVSVQIGVYIEGGLVQDIRCSAPIEWYVKVDRDILEGSDAEDLRQLWEDVATYNGIQCPDDPDNSTALDLADFQRGFCTKCGDAEHEGECDPLVDAPHCQGYNNGRLLAYSCGKRAVAHVRRSDGKMMISATAGSSSSHANLCAACLGRLVAATEVTVETRYEAREVPA